MKSLQRGLFYCLQTSSVIKIHPRRQQLGSTDPHIYISAGQFPLCLGVPRQVLELDGFIPFRNES